MLITALTDLTYRDTEWFLRAIQGRVIDSSAAGKTVTSNILIDGTTESNLVDRVMLTIIYPIHILIFQIKLMLKKRLKITQPEPEKTLSDSSP